MNRQKRVAVLLTIARIGYAHWFFGNLYEAVVRVPDRIMREAESGEGDRRRASLIGPATPVRYFLPGVPVVIGATVGASVAGWRWRNLRPWFAALFLCVFSGILATVWLVPKVNLKLFVAGQASPLPIGTVCYGSGIE